MVFLSTYGCDAYDSSGSETFRPAAVCGGMRGSCENKNADAVSIGIGRELE
jgi:hypothetical protein